MSRAATVSRRPAKAKSSVKGYLPDRIAGGLAMALDTFLLVLIVSSAHGIRQAGLAMTHGRTVDAAIFGVGLVAHFGVFRGFRWGFALAAALAAWGLVDAGVPHGIHVVFSTNLWMLLYAAFRLGSAYGPKAR